MRTHEQLLVSSLALCGLGLSGHAQSGSARAPEPVSVMRGAVGMDEVDGELRGIGADYRVRFADDRVSYTPALGSAASRTYSMDVSYRGVRRGDVDVFSAATADAAQRSGNAAHYDRAPGVRERWEVRPDGVELTYTFARPIPGSGDLLVRVDLDTALVLQPGHDPATGAFYAAEGIGGVRIGGVTGIDARGARAVGELRAFADHLDLVLPAAFVDAATYPLVLDPLIGTDYVIGVPGVDEGHPDVAYEASIDHYLFVWQRHYSTNDVAIRGQLTDAAGVPVGGTITIRDNSVVALDPAVAAANGANRFLVAWQEGASIFGPWDIIGATVDAVTGAVSPVTAIAATSASEVRPDVGGERPGGQPAGFVTWEVQGGGIRMAKLDCTGPGAPTMLASVTVSGGGNHPAITKSGGQTGRSLVVWDVPLSGVRAALVDRDLNVIVTEHPVAALGTTPGGADVDGEGNDFLVVWDQLEPGSSFGLRDVYCQKVSFDGSGLVNGAGPLPVSADPNRDERDPAVGFVQYKWAVAWGDAQVTGEPFMAYDIGVLMLDLDTCLPCGLEWIVASTGPVFDGYVEIGTARAGGPNGGDKAMIALMSGNRTPPFATEVRAQLIEAIGSGGGLTNAGGECGVPSVATINGRVALAQSNFAFRLVGAEPGVNLALFALGIPGDTFPCGSCTVLNPVLSFGVPVVNGDAVVPAPLNCNMALLGGSFAFQYWPIGSSATPCPFLPTVSFTDIRVGTVGL